MVTCVNRPYFIRLIFLLTILSLTSQEREIMENQPKAHLELMVSCNSFVIFFFVYIFIHSFTTYIEWIVLLVINTLQFESSFPTVKLRYRQSKQNEWRNGQAGFKENYINYFRFSKKQPRFSLFQHQFSELSLYCKWMRGLITLPCLHLIIHSWF